MTPPRTQRLSMHALVLSLVLTFGVRNASGAGVTLITHGFNGNVTDWVIPMGNKVPMHSGFPGTNWSLYQISITRTGSTYYTSQAFLDGAGTGSTDSGEIIIALDWSTLSGGNPATSVIATQAVTALLSTNLIPDLGGKPLVQLPLHLAGHSRGGSVIAEMARILGTQGIWVDQISFLDPHPVSLFSDPNVTNYSNVLFADCYWQNLGDGLLVPNGQAVAGAYNRQLTNLDNGYSSSHSDVHLWYHGTIDLSTPASDTQATITPTVRQTWWTGTEAAGTNTGFLFSLIGGGNRLSTSQPAGAGTAKINDGFNTFWDVGLGVAANRTRLPSNSGLWPNLLRLDVTGTNRFLLGQQIPLSFYHQSGGSTAVVETVRFFLDRDANPNNGNEILISQISVSGTGTNAVNHITTNTVPNPAAVLPGTYRVYATISDGPRTRYLYAPQSVQLDGAALIVPMLTDAQVVGGRFSCNISGAAGETIVVEVSSDFLQWSPIVTNTMTNAVFQFLDPDNAVLDQRYYRALLKP